MRVLFLTKYDRRGASSRYRAYQYFPALEREGIEVASQSLFGDAYLEQFYRTGKRPLAGSLAAVWRRVDFLRRADWEQVDAIFLQYEVIPYCPAFLETRIFDQWRKVVVDFDDAVYLAESGRLSTWGMRGVVRNKIETVMRRAREVIVGNRYLYSFAAGRARHVTLIPTAVDLDKYEMRQDQAARAPGSPLVVGWIGTPATVRYLHHLSPVLETIARESSIRLKIVGARPNWTIPGLPIECCDWSEQTEQSLLGSFDIGIMPLASEEFAKGKCGLKLIQYMALGIPAIGTRTSANEDIIADGSSGLLASSDEEWIEKLRLLIARRDWRERLGRQGRQVVEARYSIRATAGDLVRVLQRVGGQPAEAPAGEVCQRA